MTGARCQGSSIRDSDLSGAWLHSADFTECDLRDSDLSALDPKECQIKDAIINLDQTLMIVENLGFDVRVD